MHYAETRERSAELLRLALGYMGRQKAAALNPCHFALWYEHVAGLNPGLSTVLEDRIARGVDLTDADVFSLYTDHILARDVRLYEGMREQLYRILNDTAANTQSASAQASAYDQVLSKHSAQLTAGNEQVQSVQELVSETAKMRAITADLAAKLQASTEEVTVLTESLLRAKSEALQDAMTKLKNRRGFETAVHEHVQEHGNLQGCALLLVDIDHFKGVNDTHGHLVGDKVIRAVAGVMQGCVKGRDIVARLGGEEFGVLLPQTTGLGAESVGEQIRQAISHVRITGHDSRSTLQQVTVSVGVSVAHPQDTLETLTARADAALYRAKGTGRNKVVSNFTDPGPAAA